MAEKIESNPEKTKLENTIEKLQAIEHFATDHGSVYRYDEGGHLYGMQKSTEHFLSIETKIRLQEKEKQDITVFVNLDSIALKKFEETFKAGDKKAIGKTYIMEMQSDGNFKLIQNISEVTNPDELFLVITKNNLRVEQRRATLIPTVGYNHFDWRNHAQGGENFHERSLGGKVTEIGYKK
jgi:hypothetical protein